MGYETFFDGAVTITPHIADDVAEFINELSRTRRMKRDTGILIKQHAGQYGLDGKYGTEGEFFVGADGVAGQENDESVINYNSPPSTQPGLWCQWMVEGSEIVWDQSEKFYNAAEWLKYIIKNILEPRGYKCNGEIFASGEDHDDIWKMEVNNNSVKILDGFVSYHYEHRITETNIIDIPKEDANRLNELLNLSEIDFHAIGEKEDSVLATFNTTFSNGIRAYIDVCAGQNNCYLNPVLFDENGHEIMFLEPDGELTKSYDFEYEDEIYRVIIKEEE